MTTKSAPQRGSGLEWEKMYADALAIEEASPGTVCVTIKHYRENRHPVPYRLGYCHHYRQANEHYHRTHEELEGCEQ